MLWSATGQSLTNHRGTTFWFDAGATALDLAYTGDEDHWADRDLIRTPGELDAWIRPRVPASATLGASSGIDLALARALRAAIQRSVWRHADGVAPLADDVALLNDVAARPHASPRLELAGAGPVLGWTPESRVADLLPLLAAEAIDVLASAGDRLRRCGGDTCALVFLDTSRAGGRRWCSMQHCGNLHKVRAHRGRETPAT